MYEIYCDGSARNNGYSNAVGACAFVILKDGDKIKEGVIVRDGATNQQMELMAAIMALEAFTEQSGITIYTDSAYLHNCRQQRWYRNWQKNGWHNAKKQPVANRELWEKLIPYFEDERYQFKKVAGHNGVQWNEYVDNLAQDASLRRKNDNNN